jgi:TolB-like protein/Tfp pilus assembly protein PilF/predicted Ser/Thr protein kinase
MSTTCLKCHHENPEDTLYCSKCGGPLKAEEGVSVTKTLITSEKGLQKGTTFAGRYQIIDELGRGGMGVVYKAEDTKLKRTVALKFLPPELTHIPDVKDRFMREAQAAAALDHPNICTVYEFDEAEEKTFISMAYVEGRSLRKKIEAGPLDLDDALRIALQAAQGLQIAHKKGIVHRDIKSANIMVTEDNQAKIMDFGLARMTGGTLITQEGMTMGTVAYMSPEQARGEEVDHRTDIWSFGVVLYEMFGGQLPFMGEHDQAVVYSILNKKPKPLAELRSEIPVSIGQVVDKALEKNPDKRYQQIDELLDDLMSISAGIVPEEIKTRLRKAKLRRRKRAILYTCAAGLVIALVVIALDLFMGGRVEAIGSIAVLPFENLTGDAGQEYFVDGATDEVIGQLSKIGAWRVISRHSIMQFKGVDKPLPEIARELNVDAVVEGTVYQTGESVRIGVKLIDVLPEEQNLWADTYDRPMTDVLIMYSEIASTIADKTQVNLTYEEMTRLTSASQVNPESYDAYLKGLPHLNRATQEELKIALQYFDLALEIDPNNALAHVGVSGVWGIRYQFNMVQRQEAVPLITTAIEKALEIDNTLADAHAALAASKCFHEWDWEGAEKEFQQALRLNPNLADAHVSYSHLLCITGRTKEALAHSELAIELDPLNPLNYVFYGMVLTYNRRPDDAIAASRKVREIDPNLRENLAASADRLWREGKYDEALAIYRKVWADDAEATAALEDGFKKAGHKGAARAVADLFAERYGKPGNSIRAQGIADVYFQAGDYDLGFDWLEKAYEEHEPAMPYIGNPDYDPLRSYPCFQDLLRKMNLPVDEKE